MKTTIRVRKALSIAVTMAVVTVLVAGTMTASFAAQKKYALPKSETTYYAQEDDEGNIIGDELEKGETRTYTYTKKGHITKYVRKSDFMSVTETSKWTYKNGKPTKCAIRTTEKEKDQDTGKIETRRYKGNEKYDSKGRLRSSKEVRYGYNKKGWLIKLNVGWYSNTIKKMAYYNNGMPKSFSRAVNGGLGADITKYSINKKGLVTKAATNSSDPTLISYDYDNKGRVKTKWVKEKRNGEYVVVRKTEYRYGKGSTTNKKIYFGIMNHDTGASLVSADIIPSDLVFVGGTGVF